MPSKRLIAAAAPLARPVSQSQPHPSPPYAHRNTNENTKHGKAKGGHPHFLAVHARVGSGEERAMAPNGISDALGRVFQRSPSKSIALNGSGGGGGGSGSKRQRQQQQQQQPLPESGSSTQEEAAGGAAGAAAAAGGGKEGEKGGEGEKGLREASFSSSSFSSSTAGASSSTTSSEGGGSGGSSLAPSPERLRRRQWLGPLHAQQALSALQLQQQQHQGQGPRPGLQQRQGQGPPHGVAVKKPTKRQQRVCMCVWCVCVYVGVCGSVRPLVAHRSVPSLPLVCLCTDPPPPTPLSSQVGLATPAELAVPPIAWPTVGVCLLGYTLYLLPAVLTWDNPSVKVGEVWGLGFALVVWMHVCVCVCVCVCGGMDGWIRCASRLSACLCVSLP